MTPINTPNVNLHAEIQSNISKSNQAYFTQPGGGGHVIAASSKKSGHSTGQIGINPSSYGMNNFS